RSMTLLSRAVRTTPSWPCAGCCEAPRVTCLTPSGQRGKRARKSCSRSFKRGGEDKNQSMQFSSGRKASMRLMQVKTAKGRQVIAREKDRSWFVGRYKTVLDIANAAIRGKTTIAEVVSAAGDKGDADPAALLKAGRVL